MIHSIKKILERNIWNHLTVKNIIECSFKNGINKMCLEIIYLIYMYPKDLPFNNLLYLICQIIKKKLFWACLSSLLTNGLRLAPNYYFL